MTCLKCAENVNQVCEDWSFDIIQEILSLEIKNLNWLLFN